MTAGTPQLWMAVLGGRAAGCHIELHDVRFVAGPSIEATLPELRRQWFGRREGLHLDAYLAVRAVDGYAVSLGREPSAPRLERLWFVNLGAYRCTTSAWWWPAHPRRPRRRPSASGCAAPCSSTRMIWWA